MADERTLVVTGGRDHVQQGGTLFPSEQERFERLVCEYKPTIFRYGDAPGVDRAAAAVVKQLVKKLGLGIRVQRWPADWKRHGKRAGPIRNRNMLLGRSESGRDAGGKAHRVGRFPGGTGTQHCEDTALELGIEVTRIFDMRTAASFEYERLCRARIAAKSLDEKHLLSEQARQLWAGMTADDRRHINAFYAWLHPDAPSRHF